MGGRGAASGVSSKGNQYGTQYHTLLEDGNIKFVTKNTRDAETLMETMTNGRVYVTVGGDELQSITYFDKENKRVKSINLDHPHDKEKPHTHHGYFHGEKDSPKGFAKLTPKEKQMVDYVKRLWYHRLSSK